MGNGPAYKTIRCTRIRFKGYKRLANTSCNVSGKIVAFVGQNEAGKSSLLQALEWLTDDGAVALDPLLKNRTRKPSDTEVVVESTFALGSDDLKEIEDLDFAETPRKFIIQRVANGELRDGFEPDVRRNPRPFTDAHGALERARKKFPAVLTDENEDEGPTDWADAIQGLLEDPEAQWDQESVDAATSLADWLEAPANPSRTDKPRDQRSASMIRIAAEIGAREHPSEVGRRRISERVPKFILFTDTDRALATLTPIHDAAHRNVIKPALQNILTIAEIEPSALWQVHADGDSGERQTMLDNGNKRLDEFFGQAWNQSNITVSLSLTDTGLETHVREVGTGRFTRIEERSDGLRAFVALAAFLEARRDAVPPILLIDEAELHLHLNAQADLVGVLLKQIKATQVLYTTHSPGCLPSDLGTAIRMLEPDPKNKESSRIRQEFWTNSEPGFRPLLYAMGANAAAFSICRAAVLAEGAADMVLLPTLIRMATGLDDLTYQVAPGLSHAHAYDMDLDEVAARVVYLTDGDSEGRRYRTDLERANVPTDRIFSLPTDTALEDLLDEKFLHDVVRGLLSEMKLEHILNDGSFDPSIPIARALQKWGKAQEPKVSVPGKVAIAYAVLDRGDEIKMTVEGKRALKSLHGKFEVALAKSPS